MLWDRLLKKAHDNVGKSYKWDDLKHVEAEAAVKLSQQFENVKVYVKPSLIQTYTDGDSIKISGLNKADTYHDQTMLSLWSIASSLGFAECKIVQRSSNLMSILLMAFFAEGKHWKTS